MRYQIELEGREDIENQAVQMNQYELEVHADHSQLAKTIAIAQAESVGIAVNPSSVQVLTRR